MTGLDLLLLILILTLVYLGYRRGIIGEAFDIITGVVGMMVGLITYHGLGLLIDKWTEWGYKTSAWIAAGLVALPVMVALLILGMHLDRVARDDKKIPDLVMAWGGLFLSIPKTLFCLWLALMLLKASPFYSQTTAEEFQGAPVVNFVEATGGAAGRALFGVLAPAKAQKDIGPFLNKGF